MVEVLICDSDKGFALLGKEAIGKVAAKYQQEVWVENYLNGGELIHALGQKEDTKLCIVLLDIDMPELGSYNVAKILSEQFPEVLLLFVSAREELVYAAFEYHPFWFIRKSNFMAEICHALRRAFDLLECRIGKYIEISCGGEKCQNTDRKELEEVMKIFGKKYGISTLILFIGAAIITFCFLMMMSHARRKQQLEMESRGFHNEYAKNFAVLDTVSKEQLLDVLRASVQNGMVFLKNLDALNEVHAIWYQGDVQKPELENGRFFEEKECVGSERLAVVGKSYLDEIQEKEGKQFLEIDGEDYRVIGVLAAQAGTRMGKMKFINWAAAAGQYGVAGDYVLDGRDELTVKEQLQQLAGQMSETELYYSERAKSEDDSLVRIFHLETLDVIYSIMAVNFVLCGIFIIVYWTQKQRGYAEVYSLLGVGRNVFLGDMIKKFAGIVIPGALLGLAYFLFKGVG